MKVLSQFKFSWNNYKNITGLCGFRAKISDCFNTNAYFEYKLD